MATLTARALGTFTNVSGTAIVGSDPVLEVIASAADGSYVYTAQNATGTYTAAFALADMPSDFGTMSTASINLRYHWQTGTQVNSWSSLTAQIYKSDLTTPLTDAVTVASSITTTTATNSGAVTLTGVDTAATKADWDGAVVYLRLSITKSMAGDTLEKRVTAAEVTGTYALAGVVGTADVTLGSLTASAGATHPVTGNTSATLDPLTASASDTDVIAGGALSTTLGTLTVSAAGVVYDSTVTANASITLGSLTATGGATHPVVGTSAVTFGALTVTADGAAGFLANLAVTLGTLTASAGATHPVTGNTSATLGTLAASASDVDVIAGGALSTTLGSLTASASDVDVIAGGALSTTLGSLTASTSDVDVIAGGALSATLGALSLLADGIVLVPRIGTAAITLGALTASAAATHPITGSASVALGSLTVLSEGNSGIPRTGNANITLGSITLGSAVYAGFPMRTGVATGNQHLRFRRNTEFQVVGKTTNVGVWPKGTIAPRGDAVVQLKGVEVSFQNQIAGWFWGTPIDRVEVRPVRVRAGKGVAGRFVQDAHVPARVTKSGRASAGVIQPYAVQNPSETMLMMLTTKFLARSQETTQAPPPPSLLSYRNFGPEVEALAKLARGEYTNRRQSR